MCRFQHKTSAKSTLVLCELSSNLHLIHIITAFGGRQVQKRSEAEVTAPGYIQCHVSCGSYMSVDSVLVIDTSECAVDYRSDMLEVLERF